VPIKVPKKVPKKVRKKVPKKVPKKNIQQASNEAQNAHQQGEVGSAVRTSTEDAEFDSKREYGASTDEQGPSPRQQIRRLIVFQFKLYIDAIRDLLLSPLSIAAVLLDLLQRNREEKSHFSKVLHLGRRTEKAINLFEHDYSQQANRDQFNGLSEDGDGQ